MPMPISEFEPKEIRMTLLQDNFISEEGGRHTAGTVVLVDDGTARRWRARGIAVDSATTDKTLIEQKRAAIEALQAELDEIPGGRRPGVYDAIVTRTASAPEEPARRPHRAKAVTEGAHADDHTDEKD